MPAAPPLPALDPKHDAELIEAFEAVRKAPLDEAASKLAALSRLVAFKLNDPETGWRPRIWALEKSDAEKEKKLEDLEKLKGKKK